MAESLEHVVPDLVLEKLDSLLAQGIGLEKRLDVGSELKLLRATLSTIQDLVLVAEGQPTQKTEGSELGIWLYDITQAMDSMPSLLDELQLEVLGRKAAQRTRPGSIKREVRSLFSRSNLLASTISHIKEVRMKLEKIASQKPNFNSTVYAKRVVDMHVRPRHVDMYVKPRKRGMAQFSIGATDIIGRDQEKKNIIQLLMHSGDASLAQQENIMLTFAAKNISRKIRHVSFSDEDWSGHEQKVLNFLGKLTDVQTILFPVDGVGLNNESIVNTCIERFKSMQVLDLSDSRFEALPESITSLKNLRFLSLKRNDRIMKLPDSISRLKNLRALMLGGCSELSNLPKDMELMINLRHLEITTKEEALPALNSFKSLRYLGVVGCVNLKSLFLGRETFTALGTLFIHRCPSLVSLPCGVRHLSALKILRIDDCGTLDLLDGDDDNVPGLKSLKLLVIVKLPRLTTLPKWILQAAASPFNTLSCIVIEACPNFRGLPQEVLQKLDSYPKFKIEDCPKSIVSTQMHMLVTKKKRNQPPNVSEVCPCAEQ
ncbi:hypothetical protein VitviT2T_003618 [Vitis vinifera]|uniref:Rx N-terminal domain-containing protein n=1 Tax=Vitis vinifera TaxID=29760 RepID=A0ABY9BM30_VITVI|nr:hypothetical protein VitviT2T_003618 [Vitis vinifera]